MKCPGKNLFRLFVGKAFSFSQLRYSSLVCVSRTQKSHLMLTKIADLLYKLKTHCIVSHPRKIGNLQACKVPHHSASHRNEPHATSHEANGHELVNCTFGREPITKLNGVPQLSIQSPLLFSSTLILKQPIYKLTTCHNATRCELGYLLSHPRIGTVGFMW